MIAASATAVGDGPGQSAMIARKTSLRSGLRRGAARPQLSRAESNPILPAAAESQPQLAGHESSDDEIPVPMKLSALTKALLNDGEPVAENGASRARTRAQSQRPSSPSLPEQVKPVKRRSVLSSSIASIGEEREGRQTRASSAQLVDRPSSPVRSQPSRENSPVRKRVVRLSSNSQASSASFVSSIKPSKRRSNASSANISTSSAALPTRTRAPSKDRSTEEKGNVSEVKDRDVNTPSQQGRVVRIAVGSSGGRGRSTGSAPSQRPGSAPQGDEKDMPEEPRTAARSQPEVNLGSVSRLGSNGSRTRNEDNQALQSSMRVKRVGKIPGSFLSGPARRGTRRRQSEEDAENAGRLLQTNQEDGDGQHPEDLIDLGPVEDLLPSYYQPDRITSGSPVSAKHSSRPGLHRELPSAENGRVLRSRQNSPEQEEIVIPHYKIPPPRATDLPSKHDQENEAPPTFKRNKPEGILLSKEAPKPSIRAISSDAGAVRPVSPERKALGALSRNTPHRAAPAPPPKMSILDAATSTAGAAATAGAGRRRNYMKVNGKCYTRIDSLGRGGTSKVYRVAADNGKMFALKRVTLDNLDEVTIKAYKGEIDLLRKLTNVERVITLFDYELNEERHLLSLLMEVGELDLNTLLRQRFSHENAKLDPVFIRYYWQEMLECLAAVHAQDIVHSDLKPANFVLVQGRLKLIDFGIANAIAIEETVNVHREAQIGTPNYMSPESLIDSNATATGRRVSVGVKPKLMKIGKPSDIWSLGCILFQMVYGVPPFGHIPNQMARCHAIINWNYDIEFRSKGLGDVPVPPSLILTMKKCLQRDIALRPTVGELLAENDPFLFPVETPEGALPITEELLGRIIQSVVSRCRERMPSEGEALGTWPQAYWQSVGKAVGLDGKR
ncbi:kinase-like domain-containing protein [Xylariaceae sp. FL1272]|nr:kinase-like domain-containing protein [Xylariaceae sp. FL1272]